MLSNRLIERIEYNWAQLSSAFAEDLHGDPQVPHYHDVPDPEISERAWKLVHDLEPWLAHPDPARIRALYEPLGARRLAQGIPIHEVTRKIRLLERRVLALAREQKPLQSPQEIRAENELREAVDAFFNEVIASIAKGYASAQARERVAAAPTA